MRSTINDRFRFWVIRNIGEGRHDRSRPVFGRSIVYGDKYCFGNGYVDRRNVAKVTKRSQTIPSNNNDNN